MENSTNFYLNNPWKPVSHSYIVDEQLRSKLDNDGYAVVKLLSDTDLANLKALYAETHKIANGEGGMFYSVYSHDLNYRKKVHDEIGLILQPYFDKLLSNYKVMLNSFVIKASGPKSEFYVHQDTTGLDEFKYSPLSFWVPLHNIDDTNGAMCVMPGSHKLFSPYRSISFAAPYDGIHKAVKKYLTPLYLQAGEAVIFDNRIIHNSLPNLSGSERVVAISGVFPKEAVLQTCWKKPEDPNSQIEIVEHSDDYLLTHPNFLVNCHVKPETGKTLKFVDDVFPNVDEESFDTICKANGIMPVNHIASTDMEACNMIQEPVAVETAVQAEEATTGIMTKLKSLFN